MLQKAKMLATSRRFNFLSPLRIQGLSHNAIPITVMAEMANPSAGGVLFESRDAFQLRL